MTALLHLFRGQFAEVIRAGERTLLLTERLGGYPFLGIAAAMSLIPAYTVRGDYAVTESLFDLLLLGRKRTSRPIMDPTPILFGLGRIRWQQGRMGKARQFYTQMCAIADPQREIPAAHVCRAWMGSLLAAAEGCYEQAERALRQPEVLEQKDRYSTGGSTRLMLARLYLQQDRKQEALDEQAPALAHYEQLGLPWPILAEGQSIVPLLRLAIEQGLHATYAAHLLDLLAADDASHPIPLAHTGKNLTPREVEVLRLVVAGCNNRTIAQKLVISQWTVKSHLTHIYRKLDVVSRTQAVVRARELGLG
jgi:ATP/maltotriose-dependent transcriptional regulator MalT